MQFGSVLGEPNRLPFLWPGTYWARRSMTAIVRTFTPQGFLVAADGREIGVVDKLPIRRISVSLHYGPAASV